jgi:transposase
VSHLTPQYACENSLNAHVCFEGPSVFQASYGTGYTYVYNFEGNTLATLPGQQGDGTKLQLKATAEVSILDNCQGVLLLKDVQVTGPDSQVKVIIKEHKSVKSTISH